MRWVASTASGSASVRLLTLVGPAGIGKTRLALQIADELGAHMAEGTAFVDLAPIRDPDIVPQVVAEVLGLHMQAGRPAGEQVREILQHKQFLLLLDNFEQVLDAAEFVGDLIASCRQLRVLVTSRVPLRLRAEQQLVLAPLTTQSASALFYLRAQAQGRALPDDGGSLALVEAICERVDRLPLAIELAAAYVKVLSMPLLLERLETRLHLSGTRQYFPQLKGTRRDVLTRPSQSPPSALNGTKRVDVLLKLTG